MASFLGSVGLNIASKASKESKRDATQPFIMFGYDRQINFISMAIPGIVLGFVVTMNQSMYKDESLLLINPRNKDGGLRYERWNEVPCLRQYCWNHLTNVQPEQSHQLLQFQYRNFSINSNKYYQVYLWYPYMYK